MNAKQVIKETMNTPSVNAEKIDKVMEQARVRDTKAKEQSIVQQHLAKLEKNEERQNLKSSIY